MGYRSLAKGSIRFSPGIDIEDVRDNIIIAKYLPDNGNYPSIELRTYNGEVLDSIECPFDDEFKAYYITDELKELVEALGDKEYSGYIEIHGEGDGIGDLDLWRLQVKSGKVVEVRAQIVWPED